MIASSLAQSPSLDHRPRCGPLRTDAGTAPPALRVSHAMEARELKGEDRMLAGSLSESLPHVRIYMVCDGHMGADAASMVTSEFRSLLLDNLGQDGLQLIGSCTEGSEGSEPMRRAVAETFVDLENTWMGRQHLAGTTVTVIVAVHNLLTIANVGDSSAVLDTGSTTMELTRSHRLQDNAAEQERLRNSDRQLAQLGFHLQGPAKPGDQGVGPLRLWPGGLCVSRSIGDMDTGPEVVPLPHIKQVLVPDTGCRIILASDGLWDRCSLAAAARLSRGAPTPSAAAARLVAAATSPPPRSMAGAGAGLADDTSLIVVDMLPAGAAVFPALTSPSPSTSPHSPGRARRGSLFKCFQAQQPREDEGLDAAPPPPGAEGHVSLLADVDALAEYPELLNFIVRAPGGGGGSASASASGDKLGIRREFTLHNMSHLRPEAAVAMVAKSTDSSHALLQQAATSSTCPTTLAAAADGPGAYVALSSSDP